MLCSTSSRFFRLTTSRRREGAAVDSTCSAAQHKAGTQFEIFIFQFQFQFLIMAEGLATTHQHTAHPALQHHFANMEQQREAGTLGMWVFLVTEIMFFGGMFLATRCIATNMGKPSPRPAITSISNSAPINTVVLIVSSFTMAMAVFSTQVGKRRNSIIFLILTLVSGFDVFGIKAVEYKAKYDDHLIPGHLIPSNPFNPVVAQHGDTDPHKLHLPEGQTFTTSRCSTGFISR
jgi:cytochrome c oxidase subunit 3